MMKTAALAAVMVGAGGAAMVGTCPAEHVLNEPREIERVETKWLTREVIANVQLEGWREMGGFPSGGTPYYGWEGGVSPEEQYGQ